MADRPIPGAVVPPRPEVTVETFDRAHGSTAKNELLWQLAGEAYGPDYPAELQAWGMTTWWTLGRFVSGLRVGPGADLVDLACGRGGVGLWLARATGCRVTGVDWSPAAVAEAAARAARFVPAERATFIVGELTGTGLPDGFADAIVCADALFFAPDRIAALTEITRVLRPGGRLVFTADESDDATRPSAVPDWAPLVRAGGLTLVGREEIPGWAEQLQRMYDNWIANADRLRASLDEASVADLLGEAAAVGPTLGRRTGVVYTAARH